MARRLENENFLDKKMLGQRLRKLTAGLRASTCSVSKYGGTKRSSEAARIHSEPCGKVMVGRLTGLFPRAVYGVLGPGSVVGAVNQTSHPTKAGVVFEPDT